MRAPGDAPSQTSPAPTPTAGPMPTPGPAPTPAPMPSPAPAPSPTPTSAGIPPDAPAPATAPTATAIVLPAPSLVPIAERIVALTPGPSLRLVSAGKHLYAARMKSMNVTADVAGAASLKGWVVLPKAAVKAAGEGKATRDLTLARISIRQPPSGRVILKFKFDGPAQEALLRFYKVTVHVRLAATDAKGNVTTVEQSVALSD